jgi:hypothetical protein
MPRRARPWHALVCLCHAQPLSPSSERNRHRSIREAAPCLVFLSPIPAPGFRDELKGSGLGLGLTPHTHPNGMLALSAVHIRTSLHLIDAALRRARHEPAHRKTPVPETSRSSRVHNPSLAPP